jgi:hypothetical protein
MINLQRVLEKPVVKWMKLICDCFECRPAQITRQLGKACCKRRKTVFMFIPFIRC